jgi:cardiolipin synthase A/B
MLITGTLVLETLWVLGIVLAIPVLFRVLRERQSPAATTAWALILLLIPLLGLPLYFAFGTRKILRRARLRPRLKLLGHALVADTAATGADRFLRKLGLFGATAGNIVTIHSDAQAARFGLLRVIRCAQKYILVDLYFLANDKSGSEVVEALCERAKSGVEVHVVLDAAGSMGLQSKLVRQLQAAGADVHSFTPLVLGVLRRRANLRNHRKIIIADGLHAWSGGRNIADDYLADGAEARWLDLSFDLSGPAVNVLQRIAVSDIEFASGRAVAIDEQIPPGSGNADVQIVPSGPDVQDDILHALLLTSTLVAKQRIWIATPYFVPDEALHQALCLAARVGIDVRIIVPKRSDNTLIDIVRLPYLHDLVRAGAKISRYPHGMLHAKFCLFDDQFALIGSANMDARSLFLNHETMFAFYGKQERQFAEDWFQKLEARSDRAKRGPRAFTELLAGLLKILAPLL